MSDRFYTTLRVSGSNAAAAKQAAVEAMNGGWSDEPYGNLKEGFHFDHDSAEGAIRPTAEVSRNFPTEIFELHVRGGMSEGVQGLVIIHNGQVTDLRSAKNSYGNLTDHEVQISHALLRDIFVDAARGELRIPFSNVAAVLQQMCQDRKSWDRVEYHKSSVEVSGQTFIDPLTKRLNRWFYRFWENCVRGPIGRVFIRLRRHDDIQYVDTSAYELYDEQDKKNQQ